MKYILILLIIFLTVKNGNTCSCEYYEADFYKNVYKNGFNCIAVFETFETVTLEKIGEYNIQIGYFIVTDTINSGKFQIGDTIKVLGSSGANCGEQMYIFDKGDTLALALRNNYINEFLKDTFYMEGICGKHFLKIKNGKNDGLTIPEIIEKVKYSTSIDPLIADAGNDVIVCSGGNEEYILGGYPAASGGVEPYTYTWSGRHFDQKYPSGIPSWIYASDFLDDTTKSNPVITEWRNVPMEWTTYYLKVEDAEGNIMYDSVQVITSSFLLGGPYKLSVTIHKGDSVKFLGNISVFSNFEPLTEYKFSPTHGLSDPTDIYGWAKPDTSITYYLEAVNSAGCRSGKIEYWHIEVVDTITASNDFLINQLVPLIYPIPMQDYLRIDHSSTIQQVDVLDIKGIKMFSVFPMERNTRIDTGRLQEGIYIIVIKTQGSVYRNTIIKRN